MTETYTPTPLFDITNIPNILSQRQHAKNGMNVAKKTNQNQLTQAIADSKAKANLPNYNNAEEIERPLAQ